MHVIPKGALGDGTQVQAATMLDTSQDAIHVQGDVHDLSVWLMDSESDPEFQQDIVAWLASSPNREDVIRTLANISLRFYSEGRIPSLVSRYDVGLSQDLERELRHLNHLTRQTIEELGYMPFIQWRHFYPVSLLQAAAQEGTPLDEHYSGDFSLFFNAVAQPRSPARRWLVRQISKTTKDKTSLFRYPWQYQILEDEDRLSVSIEQWMESGDGPYLMLSLAASTFEEPFSMGTFAAWLTKHHPERSDGRRPQIEVRGIEIDPDRVIAARQRLASGSVDEMRIGALAEYVKELGLSTMPQILQDQVALQGGAYAEAARQLVQEHLSEVQQMVTFTEASVVDEESLQAIPQAHIIFMNTFVYQVPEKIRFALGRAIQNMREGAYLFTTRTRAELERDLKLDLSTFEIILDQNQRRVVLRKKAGQVKAPRKTSPSVLAGDGLSSDSTIERELVVGSIPSQAPGTSDDFWTRPRSRREVLRGFARTSAVVGAVSLLPFDVGALGAQERPSGAVSINYANADLATLARDYLHQAVELNQVQLITFSNALGDWQAVVDYMESDVDANAFGEFMNRVRNRVIEADRDMLEGLTGNERLLRVGERMLVTVRHSLATQDPTPQTPKSKAIKKCNAPL